MLLKPSDCSSCKLEKIGTGFQQNCVSHSIGYKSKIMFIAEALGQKEADTGIPLIGSTGSMFRAMLRQAGFEPSLVYLTNTVKCRPPKNETPSPEITTFCSDKYLWKEIEKVQPNLIVAIGGIALKVLMPNLRTTITKARGYIFKEERYGIKVLPVVHPSFVAQGNQEFWSVTVADLLKAKMEMADKTIQEIPENFNLLPTIQDIRDWHKEMKRLKPRISFDIETIGKGIYTCNLRCIGFAWSKTDAICVHFLKRGGYEYWQSQEEEEEAIWLCAQIFEDPDITKIGQNIYPFDMPVLMDFGFRFAGRCEDTLGMHHVVAVELKHSLEFLTSIYTNRFHHKDLVKNDGGMLWAEDKKLAYYNLCDCVATYECCEAINHEMDVA